MDINISSHSLESNKSEKYINNKKWTLYFIKI